MNRFVAEFGIGHGVSISPSSSSIPIINPATSEIIAHCAHATSEEIANAIDTAWEAFQGWRQTSAIERADFLLRWYERICANEQDLAELITLENGKPIAESIGEIRYSASFVRWFAEEARRIYGTQIPASTPDQRILVHKEPVGVCAIITPWNFPSAMLGRKISAALAAGCTVVCKPSEETPLSAFALAQLATEAGLPPGVLHVITGDPAQIGLAFCSSTKISKISFTGSTRVGRLLMTQSGPRLHRLSLELGGNAPFLVCADAQISKAVQGLMNSKFRNCGQTCIASNRILVHESIHTTFMEQLLIKVNDLRIGNGMEPNIHLGPMINPSAVRKVADLVQDALSKGAKLLYGSVPELNSCFVSPIVLDEIDKSMAIWSTEIFGPVVAIRSFSTDEEGLELANDTEFGLAAYVFTESQKRSWFYSEGLRFGMVGVNTGAISTAQAPFGGTKQSGFGREGSWLGIEEYLSYKYTCLDLSK